MENLEQYNQEIKKITYLFERKINLLLTKGIPAEFIEKGLLILYFDSIRITADNISITHQVNRSRQALQPLLFRILLKLSNESDQIISEEELISFKIESKK